jgi:HME family heavy-metal exporter
VFAFLVNVSLRSRALVLVISGIIIAYGVATQRDMAIDVFPNLNKGLVTIVSEARGLAPEEVEVLVTVPIEAAVSGAAGLTRVRSSSATGLSIVFAEFDWGVDIRLARQIIVERLATARSALPREVQPVLMPAASLMGEILIFAVTGETSDPMELRELADWVVATRLRATPGVSQVNAIGGEVRQYRVTPDLVAMNRLGVTVQDLEHALAAFGSNAGGGVANQASQEYQIRILGRTASLDDLRNVSIDIRGGQPVALSQIADISYQPQPRRGDAGFMGKSAVLLTVQKQPDADTLDLTRRLEAVMRDLEATVPEGVKVNQLVFRQADFIEASIGNVQQVLIEAMAAVAVVLILFLANARTTAISLIAIPLSVLMTFIVFRWSGMTLNTMTLGGLAIAIGELVDDAVVDVENIYRRLAENRLSPDRRPPLAVIIDASQEVRSGIVQSTFIIILVFVPVFAIPGIEGLFFAPLGIAYITSIFASLLVSITLTPVLCYYLLPHMPMGPHKDAWLVRKLKQINGRVLERVLNAPRPLLAGVALGCVVAIAIVPTLPRAFLPPFNEGSLMIEMSLQPGISLEESARIGRIAERVLMVVPEIRSVGRRTGRAENDELAQGVHVSELEADVELADRSMAEVMRDVRQRLAGLPGDFNVGQPIGHRLIDHVLTGAAAQVVIKIFGEDLDIIRRLATTAEQRLRGVPGLVDLRIEKQVPVPQIQVKLDPQKALAYGVQPGALTRELGGLIDGVELSDIVIGQRHFDVVMRVADASRTQQALSTMLVETKSGAVPLSHLATISEASGPNEVLRENGRRRILVLANGDGSNTRKLAPMIREALAEMPLPTGYSMSFEGIYAEQGNSSLRLLGLSLISLTMIFSLLYTRYRSMALTLIVMTNVPLALIGCVIALKVTGLELSVASMVGFITLTGISTRNGILKVNHFINLVMREGEKFDRKMIIRGSQERLVPVLTTAASACVGLIPLLLDPGAPGKEILFPVAVVIFGGLLSATVLDAMLTPLLFLKFARTAVEGLASQSSRRQVVEVY